MWFFRIVLCFFLYVYLSIHALIFIYVCYCLFIVHSCIRFDSFPFRLFSSSLFSVIICRNVFTIIQFNNNNSNHCGKVQHTRTVSQCSNMRAWTLEPISYIYIYDDMVRPMPIEQIQYSLLPRVDHNTPAYWQRNPRAKKAAFFRLFGAISIMIRKSFLFWFLTIPLMEKFTHHSNLIGGLSSR